MTPEEALVRWTVRVSLACYLVSLILRLRRASRVAQLAWTIGWGAFLLHVAIAFEFYHHWSHAAAYEATARQTKDVVGLDWGGGIWFNYLFTIVWGVDVVWWWAAPAGYENRATTIEWIIQGFMAFIAFNATVVFGAGVIRWIGAGGTLLLVIGLGYAAYRRTTSR